MPLLVGLGIGIALLMVAVLAAAISIQQPKHSDGRSTANKGGAGIGDSDGGSPGRGTGTSNSDSGAKLGDNADKQGHDQFENAEKGPQDEAEGMTGASQSGDDREQANPMSGDRVDAKQGRTDEGGEGKDVAGDQIPNPKYHTTFRIFDGIAPRNEAATGKHEAREEDTAVEFFGVEGQASKVIYVVDMSGSMAGYPFRRAREELLNSVWDLNRNQFFCVLFFNDQMIVPMEVQLVKSSYDSKKRARSNIMSLSAEGGTQPEEAVRATIKLDPDVIYILSDGEFSRGTVQRITAMNRVTDIVINTIGFQIDAKTLHQIAENNRGEYRFVP